MAIEATRTRISTIRHDTRREATRTRREHEMARHDTKRHETARNDAKWHGIGVQRGRVEALGCSLEQADSLAARRPHFIALLFAFTRMIWLDGRWVQPLPLSTL